MNKVKPFDEYATWSTLGFEAPQHDTCDKCGKDFFSLSGTCLNCKFTREGLDAFIKLCKCVTDIWWANLDDSSKRFMLMELS